MRKRQAEKALDAARRQRELANRAASRRTAPLRDPYEAAYEAEMERVHRAFLAEVERIRSRSGRAARRALPDPRRDSRAERTDPRRPGGHKHGSRPLRKRCKVCGE